MSLEVKTLRLDRAVFQQTLEKKLADLPPLPAVVSRVMQTVNDPDTSADDLNRLISLDQSLSSKLLRIVNSAYYGFPRRISTVTHAVVILGFNTVRNLVLGVSAFDVLSQRKGAVGLDRTRFWEHSVATAVAASILAGKRKPRTRAFIEEAFLTGLLHDVGGLFLDCYFPTQYAVTLAYAAREKLPSVDAEKIVLGIDHAVVGQRMGEHWNFPQSLAATFGGHHNPDPNSDFFEAIAIVHAANCLSWSCGIGSVREGVCPPLRPEVEAWLGFNEEDLAWSKRELESQFDAARDLVQAGIR